MNESHRSSTEITDVRNVPAAVGFSFLANRDSPSDTNSKGKKLYCEQE